MFVNTVVTINVYYVILRTLKVREYVICEYECFVLCEKLVCPANIY